jgi:uncharacterized protein (TIGR02246 family)
MRVAALLLLAVALSFAQENPEKAVRAVLAEQERAWNAGDLEAFVRTYGPDVIFVGKEVSRGNAGVLGRYRRNYPTAEKMGTLRFSDIEVKLLSGDYASVLGRFHLARTAAGGGDARGIFTLLLKRYGSG